MKKIFASILVWMLLVPLSASSADELSVLQEQLFLLIQKVVKLQAELNNVQKISNLPCYTLTQDLQLGARGDEVAGLHKALEAEGFDLGTDVSQRYFGPSTAAAVVAFQEKYAEDVLTPIGLKNGTGYFGKGTRDKVNEIYGCGAKPLDLTKTVLPAGKKSPPPYCNIEVVKGENRLEGCTWTNSAAPLQGIQGGPALPGKKFVGFIRDTDKALFYVWVGENAPQNFSNRWKADLLFDRGDYIFKVGTDDKATLWINDTLQANISNNGQYGERTFVVNLDEARTLSVQLDHVQETGDAKIVFGWERQ